MKEKVIMIFAVEEGRRKEADWKYLRSESIACASPACARKRWHKGYAICLSNVNIAGRT
jgi:hypothetical protein